MDRNRDMLDQIAVLAHRTTIERNRKHGMSFVPGRRQEARIYDVDGQRELIDCACSGGVHNLGHANPEIVAALKGALDAGLDGGIWFLPNQRALDIARAFEAAMPAGYPNRAVVTHSSNASIDLAIMAALRVTGRKRILACNNAYHGHTGFAAIVTGSADEGIASHYNLPRDMARFFEFGDAGDLAQNIDDTVAAVILEPICYETFEPAERAFMAELYRLCHARGVLVILDETRTGLGRTGRLWAGEAYGVAPDIMIVGKGLSGGLYPVSACLLTSALYDACINSHAYGYASSLGGNELACIVATRVLAISNRPAFLENVRERAAQAESLIGKLARRYQGAIHGGGAHGLMIHIRLASDELAAALHQACFDSGLLCHSVSKSRGPKIKLLPPLIIDAVMLEAIFDRLETALKKVLSADPASTLSAK